MHMRASSRDVQLTHLPKRRQDMPYWWLFFKKRCLGYHLLINVKKTPSCWKKRTPSYLIKVVLKLENKEEFSCTHRSCIPNSARGGQLNLPLCLYARARTMLISCRRLNSLSLPRRLWVNKLTKAISCMWHFPFPAFD